MAIHEFKNIVFNSEDKTFTILKGTIGTYNYSGIKKVSVLYEDAKYTGKSEPFSHQTIGGRGSNPFFSGAKAHIGLRFAMKNDVVLYAYISDTPSMINTFDFFEDEKEAKKIKDYVLKIIKKYAEV